MGQIFIKLVCHSLLETRSFYACACGQSPPVSLHTHSIILLIYLLKHILMIISTFYVTERILRCHWPKER